MRVDASTPTFILCMSNVFYFQPNMLFSSKPFLEELSGTFHFVQILFFHNGKLWRKNIFFFLSLTFLFFTWKTQYLMLSQCGLKVRQLPKIKVSCFSVTEKKKKKRGSFSWMGKLFLFVSAHISPWFYASPGAKRWIC